MACLSVLQVSVVITQTITNTINVNVILSLFLIRICSYLKTLQDPEEVTLRSQNMLSRIVAYI